MCETARVRSVRCDIRLSLQGETHVFLSCTAATEYRQRAELLEIRLDGTPVGFEEFVGEHGGRLQRVTVDGERLHIVYRADVDAAAAPMPVMEGEAELYLNPSRYCEVYELQDFARERFGHPEGWQAVDAVEDWIWREFTYTPELSDIDDSAASTIDKRGGMCRDYAHAGIALLRALGIPARYVSAYAPGLVPQDFHAIIEVYLEGRWWVIDPTRLSRRGSLVRIATGRDAQDCAFLTNTLSLVELDSVEVDASDDSVDTSVPDVPQVRMQLL